MDAQEEKVAQEQPDRTTRHRESSHAYYMRTRETGKYHEQLKAKNERYANDEAYRQAVREKNRERYRRQRETNAPTLEEKTVRRLSKQAAKLMAVLNKIPEDQRKIQPKDLAVLIC